MHSNLIEHPYREFERSGWQHAAGAYAGSFEKVSTLFAHSLLDAVKVRAESNVLDVACGPGSVTHLAASRGATATGVDFSPNMIAEAKRRYPSLIFRESDAEALPFADDTFDTVISNFGVNHFPFPARALSEAHRVLAPGGRLGFTTWGLPQYCVMHRLVQDAIRAAGNPKAAPPARPSGEVNEVTHCTRLLKDAGFLPESIHGELLTAHLTCKSAYDFLEILEVGTVRVAARLRAQPPENREAIVALIQTGMSEFQVNDGFRIPCAANLAVVVK